MLGRNKDHKTTTTVEKGPGLARGPALIMGAILSAIGLVLFLKAGNTPTGSFPDGTQNGQKFLGIETNGWTAWFTTAAGALLLFGAAQHLLAKTMSLVVGLALGACSVIALWDGDDVLGLAAANGWTKLGWGVAAAILLINTLMPRVKHKHAEDDTSTRTAPVATPARTATPRRTSEETVATAGKPRAHAGDREVVAPATDGTSRTTRDGTGSDDGSVAAGSTRP